MHKTKKLTKAMLIENLVDYLPDGQRGFKATLPYLDLCEALWRVVTASVDDRPMLQQALKHQRTIWNDFCDFENEQEAQRIEVQRQKHESQQAQYEAMKPKEPNLSETGWGSLNRY